VFDTLETNLDAYLQELAECLEFVRASTRLRPRLGEHVNWPGTGAAEKQLINSFLNRKTVREQLIYRALYVSTHAAFEQFVRDLVVTAADYICANIDSYENLWAELQSEHIYRTGQAMATVYQPLEHYDFDYEKLSRNIGTSVGGGGKFTLNSDALALVWGTFTPDNLDKVVNRVTVALNWDSLAKHGELAACFGDGRTRDLAKAVRASLELMVKNRNRIAHSTGIAAEVEEPQLREQIRFVRAFCHALATLMKSELTKKVVACKKQGRASTGSD